MTLGIETDQPSEGVVVITVHGEIDIRTAPELRERLSGILDGVAGRIVLDLSGVDFIDSTGLSVMVGAHKRLATQGGSLAVVPGSDAVQRVLAVTGLARLFDIHASRDSALAS